MKRILVLLGVAAFGIVLTLAGLAVDAWLHAQDATLAGREGIFALRNQGHALLGVGIALAASGVFGALYVAWGMADAPGILGRRWVRVVSAQAATLASVAAVLFALSVSEAGHQHQPGEPVATHSHDDSTSHADAAPADMHTQEDPQATNESPMNDQAHAHAAPVPVAESAPLIVAQQPVDDHAHESPAGPDAAAPAPPAADHPHEAMPAAPPAPSDTACADAYVEEVRAATARFQDFDVAVAEGYYKSTPGNVVAHYANRTYIRDGVQVDPSKPEVLMYVQTPSGMRLAGIMYLASVGQSGAPICDGAAHWHSHEEVCITGAGMVVGFATNGECAAGATAVMLPEMLHVWLVPNSRGPFDERMDPVELLKQFT